MRIDARITESFEAANGFPLEPNLVVLALMGSHSHGTYLPPEDLSAVDDIDLMGFVVPPIGYHLGLARWSHWTAQIDELDVVLYSLEKATRLLLKSNPNIVGLLWLRDDEYVYRHATFDEIQAQRHIFSAQSAAAAVRRYSYDVKNAAHLIRLLRMGAEFVETGTLQVYRTHDADELKRIKRGGWTLDHVKAEAERLALLMEPARARSPLPPEPDAAAADALLQRIHLHFPGLSLRAA